MLAPWHAIQPDAVLAGHGPIELLLVATTDDVRPYPDSGAAHEAAPEEKVEADQDGGRVGDIRVPPGPLTLFDVDVR